MSSGYALAAMEKLAAERLPAGMGFEGAGAEMRQTLGIGMFFGMLGVTVFGLMFTPVLYAAVQRLFHVRQPVQPAALPAAE